MRPSIRRSVRLLSPAVGRGLIPAITLKTNLICYFEFETIGGTTADSHTGLVANQEGTVTGVTGVVGQAMEATAPGSDFIKIETNGVIDPLFNYSSGITVAYWVRFVGAIPTTFYEPVEQFVNTFPEFRCVIDGAGSQLFGFNINDALGVGQQVNATTFGVPAPDTWYFVAHTMDATALKISVNAGVQDSTPVSVGPRAATDSHLFMGSHFFGTATMRLDQVGIWGRALTASEITSLYNGGAGRSYASL